VKDIHDVITHANFGDDRLRGSGVVAGQISAFPIDFAGRPYNTLTLPCERVMLRILDFSFSDSNQTNSELYRVAQKVVHFSAHHIFGTVQDRMKRISRKCSQASWNKD